MSAVFASAYLPSMEYVAHLLQYDSIFIEAYEHFPHQTSRNRCHILGPNGIQCLSVPIKQTHIKTPSAEVKIMSGKWKTQHWRTIETAYNRSALFEFYKEEFEELFFRNEDFLLPFNNMLLKFILSKMKVPIEIRYTDSYTPSHEMDYRFLSDVKSHKRVTHLKPLSYPQVFSARYGFTDNMSIIDFLFNGQTGKTLLSNNF